VRNSNIEKSNPTSLSFQCIINNPLLLITSNSIFNYDNSLSVNNTPLTDDCMVTYNFNGPNISSHSVSQINDKPISASICTTLFASNAIKNSPQHYQYTFSLNYNDSIIILVECTEPKKNLRS
jgi:hypothetical protein